jgi:hypothetical protein
LDGPFELRIRFRDENVRLPASRRIRKETGRQRDGYVWYDEPIAVTFEIVTQRDKGLVLEAVDVELAADGAKIEGESNQSTRRPPRSGTGEIRGIEADWWRDQGDPP